MSRIKSAIRNLNRLIIEMRLSYYRWCLDNINKAMVITKKRVDESKGSLKVWASEDLIELAEDKVVATEQIKRLQRQLNKI